MHAKDVIRQTLHLSDLIVTSYVGDLADGDLLIRPVEGMNPIAWQLGHLIVSERMMVEGIQPGSCPPLPEGFAEAHGKNAGQAEDTSKYRPKAEYLTLWQAQRAATRAVLDGLADETLDEPGPERFQMIAKTVGAVMNLAGTHPLMHVGQWVGVRRLLKKPVTI
jgi:hypothetical protein